MFIIEFWLKNKIEDIQFPIGFEQYSVNSSNSDKSVMLLNFGEINLLGSPNLKDFSVSGFFPAQHYSFCQCTPKNNPYDYINLIEKLKDTKQICRFIATSTTLNLACSITSFNYGEKDGSRDVYFTISFKEHKLVGSKKLVI
ncbi:terminase (plasmid) [Clostridiaceae bacterium 14S0207]|nr:terminase [Clostridiaceae bacterium 14S0207]